MKTGLLIGFSIFLFLISIPLFVKAQGSTATPTVLGLMTTTTASPTYPVWVPVDATHPLPATTS